MESKKLREIKRILVRGGEPSESNAIITLTSAEDLGCSQLAW